METKILCECLDRMKLLNLSKDCINAFKNDLIWESEGIGALYELNDEEKEIVKKFETENKGYKVYHMIHTYSNFGELYNIFFVSTYEEEWQRERDEFKQDLAFVYVYNKTYETDSEFGTIAIKQNIGGLMRVG